MMQLLWSLWIAMIACWPGWAGAQELVSPPDSAGVEAVPPPAVVVQPVPEGEGDAQAVAPPPQPPPVVTQPPGAGVLGGVPGGVAPPPEPVGTSELPPPPGPSGDQPLPPPAEGAMGPPADLPPPAMPQPVADPAWTQLWILPVARTLREGDMYAHYIGYTGLFGVQYGIDGNADIGAGVGWFTVNLTLKYAFLNGDGVAFGAFAGSVVPIVKDFWPYSKGGINYFLMLTVGPLLSIWNDRAELDIGFLFMPLLVWEKTVGFDADFPLMLYVGGSVRLGGSARLLLAVTNVAALGLDKIFCTVDTGPYEEGCQGGTYASEARGAYNLPTILFGLRFHGRKFAADVGLAFPIDESWWDVSDNFIAVPFVSMGHLW